MRNLTVPDRHSIPYRPRFTYMLDNMAAAIFLQQTIYRATSEDGSLKKFYKFARPCEHELYRPGDSWTEELALSRASFESARNKCAIKITRGSSRKATLEDNEAVFTDDGLLINAQHMILYWTDDQRLTWYEINEPLVRSVYEQVYPADQPRLLNIPYSEYLKTDHWMDTRARAYKRAGYRCQVCNSKDKINTHHRTYVNIGKEQDGDLVILCESCHHIFHQNGKLIKG